MTVLGTTANATDTANDDGSTLAGSGSDLGADAADPDSANTDSGADSNDSASNSSTGQSGGGGSMYLDWRGVLLIMALLCVYRRNRRLSR